MSVISKNPLHYVTKQDLKNLGLTDAEIAESYQPSGGGVFHARGAEGQGKTLLVAHKYRWLIDKGFYIPADAVGNLAFKGKYGIGYQVLKGEDLHQFLWDMTHKPLSDKIVIVDEVDSEFPARFFSDKEQTEVALRLWHTAKLHNYVFFTSHLGNSTDLIIHLASHYNLYPRQPNFETNTMEFSVVNVLDVNVTDWEAKDIIKTMLIYNRRELTEDTETEQSKLRPKYRKNGKQKGQEPVEEILESAEWGGLNLL